MALAELEKQLGEKLFDRVGRQLQINALGKNLLPKALDVLERVKEIEELSQSVDADVTGTLRISASSTVGNYLIPAVIGDFVRQHPASRLLLDVGNTEHVTKEILHFNADLGLIEGFCEHPHIEVTPWLPDRLIVFAAPDHPLAKKGALTEQDIFSAPWILRERGSGTRDVFERALKGKAHRLKTFLELGHAEAIKQAVVAGLGISCMSIHVVHRHLQEGRLVEIPTPFWDLRRDYFLIFHKKKYQTHVFKEFVRFACESASGLSDPVSN